jgi:hypothetical protein
MNNSHNMDETRNTPNSDLISRCKNACIGKTIKNLSVSPDGKFWELQMTDGDWIGFEPIRAIGAVGMQWGVRMTPNDPRSPTPPGETPKCQPVGPKGVRCSAIVRRIVQKLHDKRMAELANQKGVCRSIPQTLQFALAYLLDSQNSQNISSSVYYTYRVGQREWLGTYHPTLLSHLFLTPILLILRKTVGIFSYKGGNPPNDPSSATGREQP